LKFASLGSGSEGNALLISTRSGMTETTVMLDCGFGVREAERRLGRLGLAPSDLAGILVTHEHHDHVGGVFQFARRHRVPVWLTSGTWQSVAGRCDGVALHFCRDGEHIRIRDFEIRPYTVPHDAREPVQYVLDGGTAKLGVLTDAGHGTPHMIDALGGCTALMLECNHDPGMLAANPRYPPSLKQRISGDYGHLSNQAAADILDRVDKSKLGRVVAAHLSQKNNTPDLAREALERIAQSAGIEISIACQEQGVGWIALD